MKYKYTYAEVVKRNVRLIRDVQEFLDYVRDIEKGWDTANFLWFRGSSKAEYHLVPSIYRKDVWKYNSDDAKEIHTEFIRRGKKFFKPGQVGYSKSEWYYLMQHYGVPTRLLDWTEGAMIGLYFAVRNLDRVNTPCVWILDPKWLNKVVSKIEMVYYSDPEYLERIDKRVLKYFEHEKKLPDFPVPVLPSHVDNRIVAQKSVFTIHGKRKDGFYDLSRKHKDETKIVQLCIDTKKAEAIKEQLITLGITESTLFPDLEGLAGDIKWEYELKYKH
jgi:hypothetical protein